VKKEQTNGNVIDVSYSQKMSEILQMQTRQPSTRTQWWKSYLQFKMF